MSEAPGTIPVERQTMEVDLVCVGFGPAMGGFLTTLAPALLNADGTPAIESKAAPGMPLQVVCYERADGIGFGVSGVVTRARGIRASFPNLDVSQIPMAASVTQEKLIYLLDPIGSSRRSWVLRVADRFLRVFGGLIGLKHDAFEIPWTPRFLHKKDGLVLSIGQFNQWVGEQLMASGTVQIWPGMPVAEPLLEDERVLGVRLLDQGVERDGTPSASFLPGMDVHAALTVIGDGPVGAVGQKLDDSFGMPHGDEKREWAVGAKMVIDLPEGVDLKPGTVIHTIGYPEPEIFGFFYVHPGRIASAGIFVPSWYENPVRTSYRYLQHFLLHPYLWRYVKGGRLRSWGAKSLQESGRRGEPYLAGDGFARIGEGSGSTNVLTGSGVDEAWATGTQLGEAVLELFKDHKPFTKENLEATYVRRRRASWVEKEARIAEKSRDGFHHGVVSGLIGMALAGATRGLLSIPGRPHPIRTAEEFFARSPQEKRHRGVAPNRRAERRLPARFADGSLWLARNSLRRPTPDDASRRVARRRQSAGPRRLRRSCRVPLPHALRRLPFQSLRGDLLRRSHHRSERLIGPRLRPREMRLLRRVPLELRAREYCFPRRRGRTALGGKLNARATPPFHQAPGMKEYPVWRSE